MKFGSKLPYINPSASIHGFCSINYLLIHYSIIYVLLFSGSTTLFSYNENNDNDTIQYMRGSFLEFSLLHSKLSNRNKSYNYFTFNTINASNKQMRETAPDMCYNSKHKCECILSRYYINVLSLSNSKCLQNVRWCISSFPLLLCLLC
jgi:hypothetical protein